MSTLPLPIAAFVAGLVSFLSPCVLPLVPGYVSLISGAGVEELKSHESQLFQKVMLNSIAFIGGFSGHDSESPLGISANRGKGEGTFWYAVGFPGDGSDRVGRSRSSGDWCQRERDSFGHEPAGGAAEVGRHCGGVDAKALDGVGSGGRGPTRKGQQFG